MPDALSIVFLCLASALSESLSLLPSIFLYSPLSLYLSLSVFYIQVPVSPYVIDLNCCFPLSLQSGHCVISTTCCPCFNANQPMRKWKKNPSLHLSLFLKKNPSPFPVLSAGKGEPPACAISAKTPQISHWFGHTGFKTSFNLERPKSH